MHVGYNFFVSFITDTGHKCDKQTIGKNKLQRDKTYTFQLQVVFGAHTHTATFDLVVERENKPQLTITLNRFEQEKVFPGKR